MLTTARLRDCLTYQPETGALIFLSRPRDEFPKEQQWRTWNTRYAGKRAGSFDKDGYRIVTIDGRHYRAARIIWQIVTGHPPPHEVDHRDTDQANDRWDNLRLATSGQNKGNMKRRSNSTSRFKGVRVGKNHRPQAWIGSGSTRRYLGTFNTEEEAHTAYVVAAREAYGEFARAK